MYIKYNFKSIATAGLPYYRREVRSNGFHKYLANYYTNRVLPIVIYILAKA